MLDKFNLESLYVFSENKYYLYNGKKSTWTSVCNGLIVEPETEYIGVIKVEGEEYVVFPYSCNKIEVDVKSTEKENVYENDIINDIIRTIQTKSSLKGGKPKEVEGKIFFNTNKGDIWTDAKFSSLDNLEDKSINNHSKELTFNKNKEYYFDVNLVDKKDIKDWMYKCSGINVDVINENKGLVCEVFAEICHTVFRKWCKEDN
ncbi:MAG: hypothetical protein ACLR4X_11770 [Clostridia bacterium]